MFLLYQIFPHKTCNFAKTSVLIAILQICRVYYTKMKKKEGLGNKNILYRDNVRTLP